MANTKDELHSFIWPHSEALTIQFVSEPMNWVECLQRASRHFPVKCDAIRQTPSSSSSEPSKIEIDSVCGVWTVSVFYPDFSWLLVRCLPNDQNQYYIYMDGVRWRRVYYVPVPSPHHRIHLRLCIKWNYWSCLIYSYEFSFRHSRTEKAVTAAAAANSTIFLFLFFCFFLWVCTVQYDLSFYQHCEDAIEDFIST